VILFTIPLAIPPKTPANLNVSMAMFYNNVFTDKPDDVLQGTHIFVHIHDTAVAYVAALRKESAAGERIIISEGSLYVFVYCGCKPTKSS
jgi:nucleoside-diphosphate-sugar epimerase